MTPSPEELLDFLFSTIARKLGPIELHEGASVALGSQQAKLNDDLTERIAAGFWAMRRAGVPKPGDLVADFLKRHQIPTRSKLGWSSDEVVQRAKRYDRVIAKRSSDIEARRQWVVEKWQSACMRHQAPKKPAK